MRLIQNLSNRFPEATQSQLRQLDILIPYLWDECSVLDIVKSDLPIQIIIEELYGAQRRKLKARADASQGLVFFVFDSLADTVSVTDLKHSFRERCYELIFAVDPSCACESHGLEGRAEICCLDEMGKGFGGIEIETVYAKGRYPDWLRKKSKQFFSLSTADEIDLSEELKIFGRRKTSSSLPIEVLREEDSERELYQLVGNWLKRNVVWDHSNK